ncbi:MAG: hypothetical protein NWF09_01450 [Candidatus Bathyarchaeota archaeon]|nr:hypothetical protein [Candidatus Bathyarchaeota archaeon]
MKNKIPQTRFIALLVLILIVAVYIGNAQLISKITIPNIGQISSKEILAKSGSAEDIQAAVDAVAMAGGGTVYIPEGNFAFNVSRTKYNGRNVGVIIPGGVSLLGAGKDKTNIASITYAGEGSAMFYCDGSNERPIRISGITFKGYVYGDKDSDTGTYVGYGIYMYNGKKFRIDHCRFIDFPSAGIKATCYTSPSKLENGEYQYYWNWGVIDHCDFDNPYKLNSGSWSWGYGVDVHGGGGGTTSQAWLYNLSDILGKWDIETNPLRCASYQWNSATQSYNLVNPYGGKYFRWLVYIEDCNFRRCRHGIASNGGVFYVARHNYFEDNYPIGWPNVDVHGAQGNEGFFGGRGAEVYENIINETKKADGWGIDFRGGGGVVFNNMVISCKYGVSMRYEGENTNTVCWVNDLWIWNNTFIDVITQIVDPYSLYDEEVQYFLRQRPNYAPYPYPHPLAMSP